MWTWALERHLSAVFASIPWTWIRNGTLSRWISSFLLNTPEVSASQSTQRWPMASQLSYPPKVSISLSSSWPERIDFPAETLADGAGPSIPASSNSGAHRIALLPFLFDNLVSRLEGEVNLRFSRQPFSHWAFAFCRPPLLDFDIKSRVQGRSFRHVTQLVAAQIQKLIQKKHTLPRYRIRYKPFFRKPDQTLFESAASKQALSQLSDIKEGILEISVMELARLNPVLISDGVYCTLALGKHHTCDNTCSHCSSDGSSLKVTALGQMLGTRPSRDTSSWMSESCGRNASRWE
jgi:hypothetical protein